MKHYLASTILLLSLQPTFASEAWLLEMDSRFHEALMKRFAEGDPAACRQVTDKLPELVKSGKIKDLESITTGSATGGIVHPKAKVHPQAQGRRRSADGCGNHLHRGQRTDG